jgi:hypothetical protein
LEEASGERAGAEDEFDGGAPGGIGRGGAVEEGVEDIAGGGGPDAGEAEGGEIAAVGDDGFLGVLHGVEEESFEVGHALVFLEGAGGEGFVDEVFQDFDDELEDGEVGGGHSWMSRRRISMVPREKRAMAPRALVHSGRGCRRGRGGEIAGDAVEDLGFVARARRGSIRGRCGR